MAARPNKDKRRRAKTHHTCQPGQLIKRTDTSNPNAYVCSNVACRKMFELVIVSGKRGQIEHMFTPHDNHAGEGILPFELMPSRGGSDGR